MTHPSAHQQVDSAPATNEVQQLRAKHEKDWHVWRSSGGRLYATRWADLTGPEIDDRLPKDDRPARTLYADTERELNELIEEQHVLVATVTTGHPNPLSR